MSRWCHVWPGRVLLSYFMWVRGSYHRGHTVWMKWVGFWIPGSLSFHCTSSWPLSHNQSDIFFPRYSILNPEYLRWNNFSAINNPYKLLSALVDNLGASKGQFRPRVLFLWIVHGSAFQGKDEPGVMKIIEILERSSLFPRAAFTSWQLYPDDWLQALNPLTQPCRLLTGSLVGPASNSHGNQSFCGRAWGAWKHLCGPHGLSQLVGCVVTWSHLL